MDYFPPLVSPLFVDAGPSQTIASPHGTLHGTAYSINLGDIEIEWTLVSGPGSVTINSPNELVTGFTLTDTGLYVFRLTVTQGYWSVYDTTTVNFRLYVCPDITAQPQSSSVFESENASFSVTASVPVGSISYQWEVSTDNGVSWAQLSNDSTYSGVTSGTLEITASDGSLDDNQYRCILSNLGCVVDSDPATLTVVSCSTITTQPQDETADACDETQFSVAIDFEFPSTTYQWQLSTNSGGTWSDITDLDPYSGATTDTLLIDPVPFDGDGYWYRCVVSNNGCPDVTSNHAVLTVVDDPQVTQWVGYVNSAGGGFAADSLDIARELMCQINLSGFAHKIQWLLPLLGTGIGAARAPLIDRLGDGLAVNNNFVNGDFSQSTGLQGNGTNKTFDTGIKFTDLGTSSESGIGWWENNINLAGNVHPMGNYALGLLGQYRYVLDLRSFTRSYVYGATATNACGQAVSAVNGHYYGQRNSGSIRKIFLGGSQISTNTFVGAENGVGSQTIVVCGNSNQSGAYEPWPGRCAVAYMTDGTLTDGEVATLHQILIDHLFIPTGRPYA